MGIVNETTFFLGCCRADMTKDEMVADLAFKAKILLWSGIVLGSLSIGVLGFAVMRYSIFFQRVRPCSYIFTWISISHLTTGKKSHAYPLELNYETKETIN
jgi:hypothetical protein